MPGDVDVEIAAAPVWNTVEAACCVDIPVAHRRKCKVDVTEDKTRENAQDSLKFIDKIMEYYDPERNANLQFLLQRTPLLYLGLCT